MLVVPSVLFFVVILIDVVGFVVVVAAFNFFVVCSLLAGLPVVVDVVASAVGFVVVVVAGLLLVLDLRILSNTDWSFSFPPVVDDVSAGLDVVAAAAAGGADVGVFVFCFD